MDIDATFFKELVVALRDATESVHSEYCYSGHCRCKWELLEKAEAMVIEPNTIPLTAWNDMVLTMIDKHEVVDLDEYEVTPAMLMKYYNRGLSPEQVIYEIQTEGI